MIFNPIKIAVRSLVRDGLYSGINIGGLALGIATSVLLFLWAIDELSFDGFHAQSENLYRVNANFNRSGTVTSWPITPGPVAPYAMTEIPSVKMAGRVSGDNGQVLFTLNDKNFVEERTAYVDANFFQVFDFKLLKGNRTKPFPDTKSIIINQSTAKKFFGAEDPMGKTVRYESKDDYVVVGLMQDMPANSTLQFDILFPFDILINGYRPNDYWKSLETDWGNYNYFTYFLLKEGGNASEVGVAMSDIHHKNFKGDENLKVSYTLQPITDIHLIGADLSDAGLQTVRIFLIIGAAILAIACINYINLSTARATRRAKEVGVRKTVGANKGKLVGQFLVESGCITLLSMLLALVVIQVTLPLYNELSGKNINFNLLGVTNMMLLAGVLMSVWLVAGIYPAFVLTRFKPQEIMRGGSKVSGHNSLFRRVLVTSQFALSIAIIVGTLVVQQQLSFIQTKKLGYDKDNIFTFGLRGDMFQNRETIINSLEQHPGIEAVTMGGQEIMRIGSTTGDTDWEGKQDGQSLLIHPMNAKHNFMSVMNMELVEGEGFLNSKADTARYIVNEAAVKAMGMTNPIGKKFSLWQMPGIIVGVAKDFHHNSLKKTIEPTVIFNRPDWLWMVYVKTNNQSVKTSVAKATEIWKQYNPQYPFEYNFMDVTFDNMYKSEARTEALFSVFAIVAILVSCLGLFGLSTFTASQRTKEIGVRKVMGASVAQIVLLLSQDFVKLILLAIVVAVPASYFLMQTWLQDFAYRVNMNWMVFALAGLVAIVIGILTIGLQTTKAAVQNPTKSLRSE